MDHLSICSRSTVGFRACLVASVHFHLLNEMPPARGLHQLPSQVRLGWQHMLLAICIFPPWMIHGWSNKTSTVRPKPAQSKISAARCGPKKALAQGNIEAVCARLRPDMARSYQVKESDVSGAALTWYPTQHWQEKQRNHAKSLADPRAVRVRIVRITPGF